MSSVCARDWSRRPAASSRLRLPARKPRASGLQGIRRHALVAAQRDHLALFLAVDQVVVVLHARRTASSRARLRELLRLGELPGPHAARADVAHLAGLDDVVQRLHRLLDRRLRIEAVDLVQVDVVECPGAAGWHRPHGRCRLRDRPSAVGPRSGSAAALLPPLKSSVDRVEDLGGDHHLLAAAELAHELAGEHLALAGRVHVGGVEEVDAQLDRAPHHGARWPPRRAPRAATAACRRSSCPARCARRSGRCGRAWCISWGAESFDESVDRKNREFRRS